MVFYFNLNYLVLPKLVIFCERILQYPELQHMQECTQSHLSLQQMKTKCLPVNT